MNPQLLHKILLLLDLIDHSLMLLVLQSIIEVLLDYFLGVIALKMIAHTLNGSSDVELAGVRNFWEPAVRNGLCLTWSGHLLVLGKTLLRRVLFVKVRQPGPIAGILELILLLLGKEFGLDVAQL